LRRPSEDVHKICISLSFAEWESRLYFGVEKGYIYTDNFGHI
jgi:hypothetical protein